MNGHQDVARLAEEVEEANNWAAATGEKWALKWAREAEDKLALARAQGCQDNGRSVYQGLFRPFRAWSKTALRALRGSFTFFLLLLACQSWAVTPAQLDALVPQIIQAESSGNPRAIGDGGKSRGLMQIQKATWRRFSDESWDEAFDPEKNVQVGRAVLEQICAVYQKRMGTHATPAHIVYTYNTGKYCFGELPAWTKKHPNKIYRKILSRKERP